MDRAQIVAALARLAGRLHGRGVTGELYVIGGAAIALAYDERRSTRDIDAIFEPKMTIYEEAAAVAEELDLPAGWLNDAAKSFIGSDDPNAAPVLDLPGLRCLAASPRILIAMKVLAHRRDEDEDDVRLLADKLGLTTSAQILDVAEEVYGDRLEAAARFFVEAIFG